MIELVHDRNGLPWIDDFGTGFSSLAYLKQLPIDEIKIDKSFVTNIANDSNDRAIVNATLNLAQNLGLDTVAEGIENREAWDILSDMGCITAQGFYMSAPLPAKEFSSFALQHHDTNTIFSR